MYNIKFYYKNYEKCEFEHIPCANTFLDRFFGLMGKKIFKGLIFKQKHRSKINSSIHTCFMKATIDLIYINYDLKIEELTTLKPWQLYIPKNGNIKYIIELPEKTIQKNNLVKNMKVVINNETKKR